MNYLYPQSFVDFDSWVEFSENLRRDWQSSQIWSQYTPEQWIQFFPEMEKKVSELYLSSEVMLAKLKVNFVKSEELFSQDLNTRIYEEAFLDNTIGMAIKGLEIKVKNYKRMLAVLNPPAKVDTVTDSDIDRARKYPITNLLLEPPKRGFIHCPFHSEKTSSCKVFADHIHCFGCGKHLDSIGYLMEVEGKTFINSVKYLCQT